MTIAVEAGSLSQVTEIAANPPLQLDDFQHKHSEPLILYIARVPGRRDVFLTPVKPREKVVTAEDVQSSLYYVHVNTDDDADIVSTALQSSQRHEQDSEFLTPERLPDHKNGLVPNPYTLSDRATHSMPAMKQFPKRKPVLSDITNTSAQAALSFNNIPLLPPRPLPSLPVDDCSEIEQDCTTDYYTTSTYGMHDETLPPSLPMTPSQMDDYEALTGTLTIIRRDPATADQWNVAIVRDPMAADAPSTTSSKRSSWIKPLRSNQCPLNLEVTNPAYTLFSQAESAAKTSDTSMFSENQPPTSFHRELQLPDTISYSHSLSIPESRTSISSDDQSGKRRSRFLVNADLDPSSPYQTKRRLHYSFASPWDGQCKFTTSSTGRALKCSHQLLHSRQALDVSELRFNLPLSSQTQAADNATHTKRFSRLGNLHRRLQSHDQALGSQAFSTRSDADSNYDEDDSMSMDLSLGQERLGGGFGGKEAKLGKLIIHPDGLPMLDLLVAANIGLWWRAWERTS